MKNIQESFYFDKTELCFVVIENNDDRKTNDKLPFRVIFRFKDGFWEGDVTEEFVKDLRRLLAEQEEE